MDLLFKILFSSLDASNSGSGFCNPDIEYLRSIDKWHLILIFFQKKNKLGEKSAAIKWLLLSFGVEHSVPVNGQL